MTEPPPPNQLDTAPPTTLEGVVQRIVYENAENGCLDRKSDV